MADEIRVNFSLRSDLANEDPIVIIPDQQLITKSAIGCFSSTITVGTSEETFSTFGELTTPGLVVVRNTDTTNQVLFGSATGVYFMKLLAGEVNYWRIIPGATLYIKAEVAAVKIHITCLEN